MISIYFDLRWLGFDSLLLRRLLECFQTQLLMVFIPKHSTESLTEMAEWPTILTYFLHQLQIVLIEVFLENQFVSVHTILSPR